MILGICGGKCDIVRFEQEIKKCLICKYFFIYFQKFMYICELKYVIINRLYGSFSAQKGVVWHEKNTMQIAISGNIGAGKTELTRLLAKHYGYRAVHGSSEENPYLNSFYDDMRRWSFNNCLSYRRRALVLCVIARYMTTPMCSLPTCRVWG